MTTKSKKDYSQGKIYKIEPIGEHDEGDIYIGSTSQKWLSERMAKHRCAYKRWKSNLTEKYMTSFNIFEKYGVEKCKIILIEAVNASSYDVLVSREAYYIRLHKCVNHVVPLRTIAEYNVDNKQKIQEYKTQYYEQNKLTLTQKSKIYREEHREEIRDKKQEYYEENKLKLRQSNHEYYHNHIEEAREYNKQYYANNKEILQPQYQEYYTKNKDKILEKVKKYTDDNMDKIKEYRKEYYEKNKEVLKERAKQNRLKKKQEKLDILNNTVIVNS